MLKLMKGEKHLGRARSLLSYDYLGKEMCFYSAWAWLFSSFRSGCIGAVPSDIAA